MYVLTQYFFVSITNVKRGIKHSICGCTFWLVVYATVFVVIFVVSTFAPAASAVFIFYA